MIGYYRELRQFSQLGIGVVPALGLVARGGFRPPRGPVRLRAHRVRGLPHPVRLREGTMDYDILRQIFLRQEYAPPHAQEERLCALYERTVDAGRTPLIIDCGANVGLSSISYALRFPRARIVAVEPEPANFRLLAQNVAPYPSIRPLHAAIAATPGRVRLSNPDARSWAFRTEPDDEDGEIEAVTIPEIMRDAGADEALIVKIDIEGAEKELFSAETGWIDASVLIAFEPHDWLLPRQGGVETVLRAVMRHGPRDYVTHEENLFCYAHRVWEVSGHG